MAYAAVITRVEDGGMIRITVTETEAATTSEAMITKLPRFGRLVRQTCRLQGTGGDEGTTVDPILGEITAPATAIEGIIAENDAPAARINNVPAVPIPFYAPAGNLYHRSRTNSGADSDVTSTYYILHGWE